MQNNIQIPNAQQSILQNEDRKVDRIWYNFFQLMSDKLKNIDGGSP